ncbi:tyrosine-type recombinase/integrase [Paracidovorax avenae]|uniref:tyrosine-type recombinase/integrase n=1 Tax=Paracidovorax avenae TaxID=80867 RepID=UPI00336AB9BC
MLPSQREAAPAHPLRHYLCELPHHQGPAELGLHFHDLRHSCASEMINAKVDLYTVGAVLRHKDSRSTARYSHLATTTLADALRTVGKKTPPQAKRKAT